MEESPRWGGKHSFAQVWRYNPEWYRMMGTRCKSCGTVHYPRRLVCVNPCYSHDMEDIPLSQTGTIRDGGLQTRALEGYMDTLPQVFCTIKLDSGPHLVGEIVNLPLSMTRTFALDKKQCAQLSGKKVRMVIRRFRKHDNGDITYGHKFMLLEPIQ
jgi:uncharacterized OB-fold protein